MSKYGKEVVQLRVSFRAFSSAGTLLNHIYMTTLATEGKGFSFGFSKVLCVHMETV